MSSPVAQPVAGWLHETLDAVMVLEAASRGIIPMIPNTRNTSPSFPVASSKNQARKPPPFITSGSIFVYSEKESGIKRFTDGKVWSASRVFGNFLVSALLPSRDRSLPTHVSSLTLCKALQRN